MPLGLGGAKRDESLLWSKTSLPSEAASHAQGVCTRNTRYADGGMVPEIPYVFIGHTSRVVCLLFPKSVAVAFFVVAAPWRGFKLRLNSMLPCTSRFCGASSPASGCDIPDGNSNRDNVTECGKGGWVVHFAWEPLQPCTFNNGVPQNFACAPFLAAVGRNCCGVVGSWSVCHVYHVFEVEDAACAAAVFGLSKTPNQSARPPICQKELVLTTAAGPHQAGT